MIKAVALVLGTVVLAAASVPLQTQAPSVLTGIFTEEQAARGKTAYQANCASCHGAALISRDDSAPSLAGAEFKSSWQGKTLGEKFERVKTSMPLEQPGSLSESTYLDIVAHILRTNGYPAGTSELKADAAALKQIVIEPAPAKP